MFCTYVMINIENFFKLTRWKTLCDKSRRKAKIIQHDYFHDILAAEAGRDRCFSRVWGFAEKENERSAVIFMRKTVQRC